MDNRNKRRLRLPHRAQRFSEHTHKTNNSRLQKLAVVARRRTSHQTAVKNNVDFWTKAATELKELSNNDMTRERLRDLKVDELDDAVVESQFNSRCTGCHNDLSDRQHLQFHVTGTHQSDSVVDLTTSLPIFCSFECIHLAMIRHPEHFRTLDARFNNISCSTYGLKRYANLALQKAAVVDADNVIV